VFSFLILSLCLLYPWKIQFYESFGAKTAKEYTDDVTLQFRYQFILLP
jgi:hypothetical protein